MTGILLQLKQKHIRMIKIKHIIQIFCRAAALAVVLTSLSIPVKAQTGYFRVVGGIPHLPSVNDTASVDPLPGALVYSQADNLVMLYTGTAWKEFCTAEVPVAEEPVPYFRVTAAGIPCLAVKTSEENIAGSGAVYYPLSGGGVRISNGSAWVSAGLLASSVSFSGSTTASMGLSAGIGGVFVIPVLSADPSGVTAGAIYFSSVLEELRVYNGSGWSSACDAELPAPPEWP
jgi:hypothetical protein